LKKLILNGNQLRSLPESIRKLTSLEELSISGNPLDSSTKAVLKQLKKKKIKINK